MQHAQGGAVKLETESCGEQRLGEDLAFVRMVISLVVACVVSCHGYKAGCNQCVQVESSPFINQSANIQAVWRPGRSLPSFVCSLFIFLLRSCVREQSSRAQFQQNLGFDDQNWHNHGNWLDWCAQTGLASLCDFVKM